MEIIAKEIEKKAKEFKALGGMLADTPEAIAAHEELTDLVDFAEDHAAALAIAKKIISNFDY